MVAPPWIQHQEAAESCGNRRTNEADSVPEPELVATGDSAWERASAEVGLEVDACETVVGCAGADREVQDPICRLEHHRLERRVSLGRAGEQFFHAGLGELSELAACGVVE